MRLALDIALTFALSILQNDITVLETCFYNYLTCTITLEKAYEYALLFIKRKNNIYGVYGYNF